MNYSSFSDLDLASAPGWYALLFLAGLLGLAFGSFLNVLIYRLPRGFSVVFPGSACPQCKTPIRPRDNIPVFGWLLLGGRCRHCKARISPRYMVVEILVAVVFAVCLLRFGVSLLALKYSVFGFLIVGLIFTDAELRLLPDTMTFPGLGLGLILSLIIPVGGPAYFLWSAWSSNGFVGSLPALPSLLNSFLGAALGAGFIYAVGAAYFHLRGIEGMGFGDVKLMAMVGAFLGANLTLFTLMAASIVGLGFGLWTIGAVWVKRTLRLAAKRPLALAAPRAWQSAQLVYRHYQVPFGVFLGSAALLAVLAGDSILTWYGHFFR